MSKKLDAILVVDVEATCWAGEPPPGEQSEIIEIGLCVLDVVAGERTSLRSILVKPQYSNISPYCTELTSITPEMLSEGVSFQDACTILVDEYHSRQRTWASYGDYDRLQFVNQCEVWGVTYPFGRSHINVKNLLALQYGLKQEVNLTQGVVLLNLTFEGSLHRGVDDAWNIAAVLSRVLFTGHR